MRFDDRITGAVNKFAPNAKIVHIDVDPSELGKVVRPTVGIAADAKAALRGVLGHFEEAGERDGCKQWREEIARSQESEKRAEDEARKEYGPRSEEHTSELQSRQYLVCRLLLEKKKTIIL